MFSLLLKELIFEFYLHDCDDEGITLDTLRKDKKLRDLVKKELKKCGLVSESSSLSDESSKESYFDSSESESDQSDKKKKKCRKIKRKSLV